MVTTKRPINLLIESTSSLRSTRQVYTVRKKYLKNGKSIGNFTYIKIWTCPLILTILYAYFMPLFLECIFMLTEWQTEGCCGDKTVDYNRL